MSTHLSQFEISKDSKDNVFSHSLKASFVRGAIRTCSFQAPNILRQEKFMMAAELDFTQPWTPEELLKQIKGILKEDTPLLRREFKEVPNTLKDASQDRDCVTVMQWNILAQALSTGPDNFGRCPPDALDWERRKLCILDEILRVYPDVLCLQEVDHYDFISMALKSVGYVGCFIPKPDSPALYAKDSNGPDGCAMFYNEDELELIKQECKVLKTNKVDTNQVCIMSNFKLKNDKGKTFSIATTHLKAKEGWQDLRENQGLDLLQKLKEFTDCPLVVCGDFNADPKEKVIQAFKGSKLDLKSSYEQHKDFPQYTTWKIRGRGEKEHEVCRIIDYMWFTHTKMSLDSLLSIPTDKEIGKDRLPCMMYPSDHFALAAKYLV